MEFGYIRHKLEDDDLNEELFEKKQIAIMFENKKSINPEDYGKYGKSALKLLNKFCEKGVIIAADYPTVDRKSIYLGEIKKGSQIQPKEVKGIWYKTVQLENVKKIPYTKYPILNTIRPIRNTISRWLKAEKILPYVYNDKPLPFKVSSLTTEQLELICSEYLKIFKVINSPLLKVGGSQPKIDISGIGIEGKRVYAQVSYKDSKREIKNKIDLLKTFESEDSILIYFGPKTMSEIFEGVTYIAIEDVFETLTKYPFSTCNLMIQEMLLNF